VKSWLSRRCEVIHDVISAEASRELTAVLPLFQGFYMLVTAPNGQPVACFVAAAARRPARLRHLGTWPVAPSQRASETHWVIEARVKLAPDGCIERPMPSRAPSRKVMGCGARNPDRRRPWQTKYAQLQRRDVPLIACPAITDSTGPVQATADITAWRLCQIQAPRAGIRGFLPGCPP